MKFPLDIVRRCRAGSAAMPSSLVWLLLLMSALSVNNLQAALTTVPAGPLTLPCSTTGGTTAVTFVVRSSTTISSAIAITMGSVPAGVTITPATSQTLTVAAQAAGITYTLRSAAGCAGATAGTNTVTLQFLANSVNDLLLSISHQVVATTSGLTTPSSVAITCVVAGSVYTPGPAQAVSVASAVTAANGGSPFTVDTSTTGSTGAAAAWATVSPLTGMNANSTTPVALSVVAKVGCGGFAAGTTNTTTVTLLNAPAPTKVIAVTLRVLPPTPLIATPATAVITYVKGSTSAGRADIAITASAGTPFFTVDTATLPIWLTVDATNGTVPRSLRFSSTSVADTLAAGTYRGTVKLRVANYGDLSLPVSIAVNNPPPQLSLKEGTTRNLSWTVGQALPTLLMTAVSSDSPIPFTLTTSGNLAPIVAASQQSGLAYGFGTQIPVTFDPLVFAAAIPGNVLIGTVSLGWGSPARTLVVTINITIQAAGATVTAISPASLPTASSGTAFTLVLTGSEFINSSDPALRTRVGIVTAGSVVNNTNIISNIVNGSNIILTIIAPAVVDAALPFSPSGNGGTVVIGVCNPSGATCTTATGSAILSIGNNPIIQGVTSASAYQQVTAPALQGVAPYDMVSIFGSNFCSSGGSGCSSSQVLYGVPNALTLTYPRTISPDAVGATQRSTVVTFQTTASTPVVIATAPILFATNNQINVMVPAAVSAQIGNTVHMVVSFGYGTGTTLKQSAVFPVTVAATAPGLFTIGSNGQGDGAILDTNWAVVAPANPSGIRTNAGAATGGASDTIQIYLTGLGTPSTGADNATAGSGYVWGTDCISTTSYLTSLNALATSSLTSVDGTVILSSLLNTNRLVPCIATGSTNSPSVTIGGRAAVVSYAGFLPDSIAGLYQINAKLPVNGAATFTNSAGATVASITALTQLPIIVTANGVASQTGVNLWVLPRLKVTGPSGAGLTGTVGVLWSTSNNVVAATEGTSPYLYSLTSGLLPSGLSFNSTTGAITGIPNANTSGTYLVTAKGTDSAHVPVTGPVNFTITVAGGLFVISSGASASPYLGTFGTANASIATVTATSGIFPYTYAITSPVSIPAGMTVNASSGVVAILSTTPAGNYTVIVTGTDSTSTTAVTGSTSFAINLALLMTPSATATPTNGAAGPVRTITATGGTGTITYATATAGFTVNGSTGVVSSTNGTAAGTYTVIVTATDGTAAPGASSVATGTVTFSATVL